MAGGTALAQAITIFFTPIITRLFPPEAYGALGTFSSLIVIVTPLVAMTYPMAIVLAENDREAKALGRLSILIALAFSAIVLILGLLFSHPLSQYLSVDSKGWLPYLLAFAVFFAGAAQIYRSNLIRRKSFSILAKIEIANSLVNNLAKVTAGSLSPVSIALIGVYSAGQAVQSLLYRAGAKAGVRAARSTEPTTAIELRLVAKKYNDFALYRAPQGFLNATSQSLPILVLGLVFSQSIVGYYALAKSILSAPITLVGKSVTDVFYPRLVDAVAAGEDVSNLLGKATLVLFLLAVAPFSVVFIFGPELFSWAFGGQWLEAGRYAAWLSVWFLFGFINRPAVAAIAPLRLQSFLLKYELLSIVAKGVALAIGVFYIKEPLSAVAVFSVTGALLNFYLVFYVVRKSKFISHV